MDKRRSKRQNKKGQLSINSWQDKQFVMSIWNFIDKWNEYYKNYYEKHPEEYTNYKLDRTEFTRRAYIEFMNNHKIPED